MNVLRIMVYEIFLKIFYKKIYIYKKKVTNFFDFFFIFFIIIHKSCIKIFLKWFINKCPKGTQ